MRWIDSLEAAAADRMDEALHRYVRQGAGAGRSVLAAEAAWQELVLRPRVLVDVSRVRTATTVLGTPVDLPVLVAPTTLQAALHPDGDAATVRGAGAAGSLACVSSNAGVPFAAVGSEGMPWWLQVYVTRDRASTVDLLQRAVHAGARAVVLTADTPVVGRKEDPVGEPTAWDLVARGALRANLGTGSTEEALEKADDLTPDTIGWLHEITGLPVVVKGVLRADDARRCAEAGAAAVVVSNHGGRQLDGAVAPARALPEVADALAGSAVEVYVDGGLRRGEHVLSALALGARAVLVGRPALWALAVDGATGVQRLLAELGAELTAAMRLAGCPHLAAVSADLIG